ncbi:MAG: hypothetical protein DRJ10_01915 [Bacteroidetes bacterium]|nr:MAG: hypothetical protein DRI74_08905 [Bacteroidota bacterium]RLD84165.1 MAG: hypothetical protein DRJ10_01915 [Bacteroidota bacterium]
MPRVNVKYKFVKDAFIDFIKLIEFQGKKADFQNDYIGDNQYEGKVENVSVMDQIEIEIEVAGVTDAECTLEASIVKIRKTGTNDDGSPKYSEVGETKQIVGLPIHLKVLNNSIYYVKKHTIKWV